MSNHQQNPQVVLRRLQDTMVQQAEELVLSMSLDEKTLEKGRTQTSKAIEVIQSAQSLNVFVNWLRYQAARSSSETFWRHTPNGGESLARGLVRKLGELQQTVQTELNGLEPELQNQAVMQAATRFLGYFRRSLIGAKYLHEIRVPQRASAPTAKEQSDG